MLWLGQTLGRLDGSRLFVGRADGRVEGDWLGEMLWLGGTLGRWEGSRLVVGTEDGAIDGSWLELGIRDG